MQQAKYSNYLLIAGVLLLALIPLVFVKGEFMGADEEAEEAITTLNPDFEPWFESILEPPSGEVESLLFSTQAAIGGGIVGYVIGLYKGRNAPPNR
ncbi:MAG: energy-coupling factor ABC transporter substrate-binding protein [Gloeocapsa sp. DLM2.Bin57]|nr:MAG: energy-coupling factor ABC transporter substrate-binding protein [Gloeocapsa sp. DLM2.Bin57]